MRIRAKEKIYGATQSEPTLPALATYTSCIRGEGFMISKIPVTCSISGGTKEPKRKYYIRSLHNVVDQSDIILVVLDARDPEGCRSRLVEEQVRRRELEGKKLVSVLNKIDLIPRLNNAQRTTFSVFRITTPTHQHRIFNSFITQLLTAFKPKACHRSMEWLATPM